MNLPEQLVIIPSLYEKVSKMAILPVCTWGNPILKTRAKDVKAVDERIRQLSQDMLETMRAENGIGLAANQVGVAERIFVVEIPCQDGKANPHTLLNPVITYRSKQKEIQEEGCLSFPEIFGPVERPLEVEVMGEDLEGNQISIRGAGLLARAFQHELDHLDGIVFVERMNMVHRVMLNKPLRELARKTKASLTNSNTAKL